METLDHPWEGDNAARLSDLLRYTLGTEVEINFTPTDKQVQEIEERVDGTKPTPA